MSLMGDSEAGLEAEQPQVGIDDLHQTLLQLRIVELRAGQLDQFQLTANVVSPAQYAFQTAWRIKRSDGYLKVMRGLAWRGCWAIAH